MNIYEFTAANIVNFLLIFARISSIFVVALFFGSRNIPLMAKAALSLFLSFMLLPIVKTDVNIPQNLIHFVTLVAKEIFVGLVIGFATLLALAAIQFGGHIIDIQMGFAILNVIEPQAGTQTSMIGQLSYLFALLLFLILQGHHLIIKALFESFDVISLGAAIYTPALTKSFVTLTGEIFIIGLKISLPAVGLIFLAELSQGIIARTVPQINIFLVGFPLRIGLGLFILGISIPFFIYVAKPIIYKIYYDMMIVIKILGR